MSVYTYKFPEMARLANEEIERDGFSKQDVFIAVKLHDRDTIQKIVDHAYSQSAEKGKSAVDFVQATYKSLGGECKFETHTTWLGFGQEYTLLAKTTLVQTPSDADAWQHLKNALIEEHPAPTADGYHL